MFFRTRVLAVPILGLLFGDGTMSDASAQEASAQEGPTPSVLKVVPESLTLEVGATATLTATVEDADGNPIERTVVFYSRRRRSVGVNPAGVVEAYRPGEHVLIAMVPNFVPVLLFFGTLGAGAATLSIPTSLIGCIALGIAVDDTVHFLVAYRHEREAGRTPEDAAAHTIRTVGRPIW